MGRGRLTRHGGNVAAIDTDVIQGLIAKNREGACRRAGLLCHHNGSP